MKNFLLSLGLFALFVSCSGTKQIERALSSGNYDQAINNTLKKLKINKDKKRKAEYVALLENAYNKVVTRDLSTIDFLKKDGNPANFERIYKMYNHLSTRQESIKPILPLYNENGMVNLSFSDYSDEIIAFKAKTSTYIYNNAKTLLNSKNKLDARKAFQEFEYLDQINPDYNDVRLLREKAHKKGTDYVLVGMKNDTRQVIPKRLEADLLNFGTYGLNDLWMVYHNTRDTNISYDFSMQVNLRAISISPEQVKEREIIKEKQVVDGWKYALDTNGNVLTDSLGNKIKVDKFVTVRCEYYESKQLKLANITGNVEYKDLKNNQLIDAFPIQSEFIFEHIYATSRGDRRALDQTLMGFLNNRVVPFPTNEQMIYDTGEDLKLQLKEIITGNSFRH